MSLRWFCKYRGISKENRVSTLFAMHYTDYPTIWVEKETGKDDDNQNVVHKIAIKAL